MGKQEHWRRVFSTRRRKKFRAAGGSGAASSPLAFLAGGDLQNTKKRPQTVDFIFFSFLLFGSIFFLSVFSYGLLFFPSSVADLEVVEGVLEVGAVGVAAGERDSGGSVGCCFAAVARVRWSRYGEGRGCWLCGSVASLLLLVAGPVYDGCGSAEKGEDDGEGKWRGGSVCGSGRRLAGKMRRIGFDFLIIPSVNSLGNSVGKL